MIQLLNILCFIQLSLSCFQQFYGPRRDTTSVIGLCYNIVMYLGSTFTYKGKGSLHLLSSSTLVVYLFCIHLFLDVQSLTVTISHYCLPRIKILGKVKCSEIGPLNASTVSP